MKLVVIVLNKLDCLDKLLTAFGKNSIPGATILSSRGMAQTLEAHDELRFIGSLRMLMNANYKENRTILMAVPDEKVDTVVELVNKATGGLDQPDSGILFTLPIDRVEGMTHK
ncbi:MAG: P-II family nitrogen regulator [Candidatus Faecousia sp.]|jgi:nitrogen regulatory protein PII|uniref:P-II family nitrogen regulator n=1 Tax=Faecousia sp. TaxID=2952921 RepID=UPI002A8BC058|nr:P-II family nitrogen regulator [Candidatus Faecousia sp.]